MAAEQLAAYDPCAQGATFKFGGTKDFTIKIVEPSSGGGSSGLSGGGVFLIILVVAAFVYVVIGCIYNSQVKKADNWRDRCPQNTFWFSLPGLVCDGCRYTKNKLTGGTGHSRAGELNDDSL